MAQHQRPGGEQCSASALPVSPSTVPTQGWHRSLAEALRDRDMRVLWLATIAYHLALGMQQVLLGWVALTLSNSESLVGLVFAVPSDTTTLSRCV